MLHKNFRPSKIEQYELCPASFQMQIGLEDKEGEESEDAKEGKMLHALVAKGVKPTEKDKLSVEQATCVERCLELLETFKEKNWLHEEKLSIVNDDFKEIIGGTADAISVDESEEGRAILIDWKFGRNPVAKVKYNRQMQIYAASLFQNYDIATVDAYIFQPRVKDGLDKCTFARKDMDTANIVMKVWERCNNGLQFFPSKQACQYCKAKTICPAFERWGQEAKGELLKIEHTHELTIDKMPAALEQAQIAKSIVKQLEEKISGIEHQAKQFLIENQQIPGWTIKTKQGNRTCTHPNQLWSALSNVMHQGKPLITVEEFMGCVDVSIREVEELFCKTAVASKLTKTQKEAKAMLEKMIVPYIGRKPDSLILKKIESQED